MSYDLGLYYDDEPAVVERHNEGGILVIPNGRTQAEINVTYNYSPFFYRCLDQEKGLRWLYGKTGAETAPRLEKAAKTLGIQRWDGPYYTISVPGGLLGETYSMWLNHPLHSFSTITLNILARNQPLGRTVFDKLRQDGFEVFDTGGYYAPCPGNAGYILAVLLYWAEQHPGAVWNGD